MTRGEGAVKTDISQGLIAQVSGKARDLISGVTNSWFGPGQPIEPAAPGVNPARVLDYTFTTNMQFQPKAVDGGSVAFWQMRALADNYDILRLVIETRKDQVSKIPFVFRKKMTPGVGEKSASLTANGDPRVKKLHDFFERPDGDHFWSTWIRMVLEEVFVTDTPCVVPRFNRMKEIACLDVIDGTTINRFIDVQGRTPVPPNPAYSQVIHGLSMANFTTDELVYVPRNARAHKIYGYSPVEQIIITVNTALRRQMSKLAYYTDGNIPEALACVPDTWSAQEITNFQNMFDALKGDVQAQRRLRFVPALHQFIPTKDAMLKDEMDEWLARVVCYTLSVSPTPFTKAVNRASAQVSEEAALSEGMLPILVYLAQFINTLVKKFHKIDDLEFAWKINNETDALKLAQTHKIYAEMNALDIDEIRDDLGRDPAEGKIDNGLNPTNEGRPAGPTGKGTGVQAKENTKAGDTATKED